MLAKKNILTFQEIYFKKFGIHLEEAAAIEKATKVLVMYQLISRREVGLESLDSEPHKSGSPEFDTPPASA